MNGLCGRTITTTSYPAGQSCCIRRKASRSSRLIRFRTAAVPTGRPMLMPSRGCGRSFGFAKITTGPRLSFTRRSRIALYVPSPARRNAFGNAYVRLGTHTSYPTAGSLALSHLAHRLLQLLDVRDLAVVNVLGELLKPRRDSQFAGIERGQHGSVDFPSACRFNE